MPPMPTIRARAGWVPLLLGLAGGCSTEGQRGADRPSADTAPDSGGALDTGPAPTPDPEPDRPAPYCRSLDPSWRASYASELDRTLADLIEDGGLQGDARVYVTPDGTCAWRDLPDIDPPLPQLGRDLFFSLDLSGDRDVACATCHHPLLGGGDALSLSVGPGREPHAMGADRVRGLTDPGVLQVARNAPTTFNIGLWDTALSWDGRVEALTPVVGRNGAGSPIRSVDPAGLERDDAPANLVAAQAWQPVANLHEMGGGWGERFDSATALLDAIARRFADQPEWVARFEAVCATEPLPTTWTSACATGDPDALVSFSHIAHALGEYQRSQVFTQSPWAAYVQGDVDAIGPVAKEGARVFLSSLADGGQGCGTCHAGDLFTDESMHAIAGHQIGPGVAGDGVDLGRQGVTGDPADAWRFRTPTLLNVEVTGPYFHAGSMASLSQTVVFYRDIPFHVADYFGSPDRPTLHPRPWCRMTQWESLPGCDTLYGADLTHGGDVLAFLDEDVDDIDAFEGSVSVPLVAFLRSLTDPRVRDPDVLAAWVAPDSELDVTETSSEWEEYCEVMAERDSMLNLRTKGFRWIVTGEVADGRTVNAAARLHDLFGFAYWQEVEPHFASATGLTADAESLAIVTLETLAPAQRSTLLAAYRALTEDGPYSDLLGRRAEVFAAFGALRGGEGPPDDGWHSPHTEAVAAEGQLLAAMAEAYRATLDSLPVPERAAHRAALEAVVHGELSALPAGVYDPSTPSVALSAEVQAEWDAVDRPGGPDLALFVAQYATYWTGRACTLGFMPRLEEGARRANYFGFLSWSERYAFDLQTGTRGMGPLLAEITTVMGDEETELDIVSAARTADARSLQAQRAQTTARADVAAVLVALQADDLGEADVRGPLDRVAETYGEVGEHERDQLTAELQYYLTFSAGLARSGRTRLAEYLACIEHPDTQAMRGHGGFAAMGGGTCVP